jgi:uncharacterized membrane protein YvbJ
MNKKPRFFCDNCGCEVDRNAKACPQCGRYFASVRCPSCGFTGDEQAFSGGCPSCGYSAPPSLKAQPPAGSPAPLPPEKKIPARPLPLWVYVFSIGAFICICAILLFRLLR